MARFLEDWESPSSRFAQFYTQPHIASACLAVLRQEVVIPADAFWVEPSAGAGAFYDLLPPARRFGCDIDPPPGSSLLKADFLAYPVQEFAQHPFVVTVGNPPFGLSRAHGAVCATFFNRCALFSEVIAFILPAGYSAKVPNSWMLEFDPSFELVKEYTLSGSSFWRPGEEGSFSFPCVFQIYRRSRLFPTPYEAYLAKVSV